MSTVVKDLGAVSAYAYAVEKGYTGTEAEFAELMADYAEVGQRAEDAADSALESKTAAQTAATTATNKATEATTAATTATNKAAEAQADADAAALDASQALSAASTATSKATEATTAAATATSAATTATTAKDDAVSAKTAAQTAQTGAETAAASVQSSAAQIQTNADDISELKEDLTNKLDSKIEICPPETESFDNNPTTAWFTYQDITLKKGVTYSVNANTKNDTHTAKFALVDTLTSTVVSIIDSGNTVTITPTCDCWLLVNGCKYGTGSNFRAVKASKQTLSVGTVVNFTVNINTVTFDLLVYAVIADEDVVNGLVLVNRFNNRKVVTVDINGNSDYTSVINAMNTEPEGTVIYILPGVYEQDMTSCLKKRVILVGADRNQCIIRDTDGRYGHHALYVSCGYFENLTIEEPYVNGESQEIGMGLGAYAVHIDVDSDYAIGKQAEFHHCTIKSDFFPAMGVGLRKDMTLILDDCILENNQIANRGDYSDEGTLGALYFHDSNGAQGNQYVILKDNVFKSKLQYALCPYQVDRETQNNRVYCDFIRNVLYSDVGKYSDTVWFRGDPFNPSTGIFSIGIGYGNSIASLNNN